MCCGQKLVLDCIYSAITVFGDYYSVTDFNGMGMEIYFSSSFHLAPLATPQLQCPRGLSEPGSGLHCMKSDSQKKMSSHVSSFLGTNRVAPTEERSDPMGLAGNYAFMSLYTLHVDGTSQQCFLPFMSLEALQVPTNGC